MNTKECAVLLSLISLDRPNAIRISLHTAIPKSTIEKVISNLRKNYQIEINFIPPQQTRYYKIRSWGLFESGQLIKKFLEEK